MDIQVKKQIKQEISQVIKLEDLPKRPKGDYMKNKSSEKTVVSNYFNVKIKPFENIYIFKIVFEPFVMHDNRKLKSELLNEAMPSICKQIKNPVVGGMNIYSVSEPYSTQGEHQAREYKITISQVKVLNVFKNSKVMLQFLNNGIRNIMSSLNYVQIGRTGKYFNITKKRSIETNLVTYPGFKVNFQLAEGGLFLRVDPANKIVQNKTVLNYIDDVVRKCGKSDKLQRRQLMKQTLINNVIMTNYGKTRYIKIQDIKFEPLEEKMIKIRQGAAEEQINILEYYKKKYNLVIKNLKQPLLVIENNNIIKKKNKAIEKQEIIMLPQLCLMTGLPDDMDEFKRKKVTEYSVVGPQTKFKNIKDFVVTEIKKTVEEQTLVNLGIQINANPQVVNVNVVNAPVLKLQTQTVQKGKQAFFNLFKQRIFFSNKKLNIGFIHVDCSVVEDLIDTFESTSSSNGIQMTKKLYRISARGGSFNYKEEILKCVQKAIENQCNCCLIILPSNMKSSYKDIKSACLGKDSMITQIVVESTLKRNGAKSIHTKLLHQLACKMGNILWQPKASNEIMQRDTMLLSFDVSKAGEFKKIVGLASFDKSFSSYFSKSLDFVESSDKFTKMIELTMSLINSYVEKNKYWPKEMIILTNSCPKNEIALVFNYFIESLKQKIRDISPDRQPKLTYIQASDLCNQRFFTNQQDYISNPEPGTVISKTIVSQNYDFYMIPQKSHKGCTKPIHFNVIYSDSNLEEGIIQELMYHQCFNYCNWAGSIKMPAIMQYAKKFAKFCSENLKENIEAPTLINRLYYI